MRSGCSATSSISVASSRLSSAGLRKFCTRRDGRGGERDRCGSHNPRDAPNESKPLSMISVPPRAEALDGIEPTLRARVVNSAAARAAIGSKCLFQR